MVILTELAETERSALLDTLRDRGDFVSVEVFDFCASSLTRQPVTTMVSIPQTRRQAVPGVSDSHSCVFLNTHLYSGLNTHLYSESFYLLSYGSRFCLPGGCVLARL